MLRFVSVAPVRERGLKCGKSYIARQINGRSREGAWIEIAHIADNTLQVAVAPVRERGLK